MTLLALQISTVVHLVCCEECETAANRKMVSDAYRTCIVLPYSYVVPVV